LHYITVDSSIIAKFPMPNGKLLKHISAATYYRLLIPELLPSTVQKVIYLDCDIIVRKSLHELWDTDISNFALGAVHQIVDEIIHAQRLSYPLKFGYFNAGVLLINVDYWRKHNIQNKLISYLINNYKTIIYHDQDALNAILFDKTLLLPCKWNMLNFFFMKAVFKAVGKINNQIITEYAEYKNMLIKDRVDPAVIHYVSKPKPWQQYCIHPYAKVYFQYARATYNFKEIHEPNKIINYLYFIAHCVFTALLDLLRPIYRKLKA